MTPYRPQVISVSERMHSTLHAMLSMCSNTAQNNWAEVLPFIQLAHNTSFSSTMHEFAHSTRENLQIAFELARRNLSKLINR